MALKGQKHLNSFANDEHDMETYRKRVATHIDGNTVSYEDQSFIEADSPVVLDFTTDSGRIGTKGYLVNDGPGSLKVEISSDSSTYGGQHTLKGGDILVLNDLKIKKIRLTWMQNTSYRAMIG